MIELLPLKVTCLIVLVSIMREPVPAGYGAPSTVPLSVVCTALGSWSGSLVLLVSIGKDLDWCVHSRNTDSSDGQIHDSILVADCQSNLLSTNRSVDSLANRAVGKDEVRLIVVARTR